MRLLYVEDEPELAATLSAALARRSYVVDHVATLAEAHEAILSGGHGLVLLDRRLPDGDGITLLPTLRRLAVPPPAIVLTAKDDVPSRVEGLDAGADDYLVKPFDIEELLARMRALARRPHVTAERAITLGALRFDLDSRETSVGGSSVVLPRRELLALELLLRRQGRTVTREALEAAVFGQDDIVGPAAIEPHLSRLRRRLEDADAGVEIKPLRGIGYILRVVP